MKLAQKSAEKILRKWQSRLGLDEWNLKIRVCDQPGCWGSADVLPQKKQAIIRVDPRLHSEESVDDWPWKSADHERTIVHELLHCHLYQLRVKGKTKGHHEEQIIHALSEAFVKIARRKT